MCGDLGGRAGGETGAAGICLVPFSCVCEVMWQTLGLWFYHGRFFSLSIFFSSLIFSYVFQVYVFVLFVCRDVYDTYFPRCACFNLV